MQGGASQLHPTHTHTGAHTCTQALSPGAPAPSSASPLCPLKGSCGAMKGWDPTESHVSQDVCEPHALTRCTDGMRGTRFLMGTLRRSWACLPSGDSGATTAVGMSPAGQCLPGTRAPGPTNAAHTTTAEASGGPQRGPPLRESQKRGQKTPRPGTWTQGPPKHPGPALRVTPRELKSHLLLGSQPGGPRDHEPMQTSAENRPPSPLPQVYGVLPTARRLPSPSQAAPTGT